jgi:hypothetical protein
MNEKFIQVLSMQGGANKRGDSHDDRHILFKHNQIHPSNEEVNYNFYSNFNLKLLFSSLMKLSIIQELVTSCEKALKLVSDEIAEQ